MVVEHNALTDPELHEPKGVAAASDGQVYIADEAGSGNWRYIPHSAFYYDDIGTGTTLTTPTAYTLIGPATTGDSNPKEFTHNSLGRLTYTGATTVDVNVQAAISFKHSTGAGTDCFFQVFRNGTAVAGTQHVIEASTAYVHITMSGHIEDLATNDYIEVHCKTSSGNIIIHAINMTVETRI